MVQRGELACHLIGLGVADGHGGDQADVRRQCGQGRQNGQWLEAVEVMGAGLGVDMQAVGNKHEIKARRFGQFGLLLVETEVGTGVGLRLRVAPFAPAVADTVDHGTEFQLAWLAHVLLLSARLGRGGYAWR